MAVTHVEVPDPSPVTTRLIPLKMSWLSACRRAGGKQWRWSLYLCNL